MAEKLKIGDTFPAITLDMIEGGPINLPRDLSSKHKVILFYRGHW